MANIYFTWKSTTIEKVKRTEMSTRDSNGNDYKIFNDPIHGHIKVNPLCVKIIDTIEFQRLRYLKQLGTAYYVYPGAPHNRFEHSIGVYHLAGEFARTLQQNQRELDITDKDILCIEIAGLCHDLGHGPFSHTFDQGFIPRVAIGRKWKHEEASLKMLDHLIKNNKDVELAFKEYGLEKQDIIFIKEMINGPLTAAEDPNEMPKEEERTIIYKKEEETSDKPETSSDPITQKKYPYQGRPEEKVFLYEIVSNKRNGIDVDKWDYFARDCHMLGMRNNFDHKRYMMFLRVNNVVGEGRQICVRDKEASNIYGMFNTRATLHRNAYQHKVTAGINLMILDALVEANDHIKIPVENREPLKMSEAIDDMEAYSKLNDGIIHVITLSDDKNLTKSQAILKDIHSRNIYKCVGESTQSDDKKVEQGDISRIRKEIIEMTDEVDTCLTEDDIDIVLRKFDYGMKATNPVDSVRFYRKETKNVAFKMTKEAVSHMLPMKFEERVVAVYCKDTNDHEKHQIIKRRFENWCTKSENPKMEQPIIWLGPMEKMQ